MISRIGLLSAHCRLLMVPASFRNRTQRRYLIAEEGTLAPNNRTQRRYLIAEEGTLAPNNRTQRRYLIAEEGTLAT